MHLADGRAARSLTVYFRHDLHPDGMTHARLARTAGSFLLSDVLRSNVAAGPPRLLTTEKGGSYTAWIDTSLVLDPISVSAASSGPLFLDQMGVDVLPCQIDSLTVAYASSKPCIRSQHVGP